MKPLFPILAAALLSSAALALGADEQTEGEPAAAKTERLGGDCLFSRTISNWQVVDNETLIVSAPTRKSQYLVKLWHPVFGLKSEFTLGFQDGNNDGQFCDYGRDAIIVNGPAGAERYNIRSVRRLDEGEAQALLAQAKEKKKPEGATLPEQSDMKSDKDQQPDKKPEN